MKKLIAISALSVIALLAGNTVYADSGISASAGAEISITDPNGGTGATLDYSASPGVLIAWGTSAGSYALTSMNATASDTEQNEYGIHSGYSGYYQHPVATADTFGIDVQNLTNVDSDSLDIADPFGAWTPMGGGGAAAGS